MAMQTILWTALPFGRVEAGENAGRLRVSAMVSPRLTPQSAAEGRLAAFPEFVDWPDVLSRAKFALETGAGATALVPITKPDSDLWKKLLPDGTPVAGFQYKDMGAVNLRSWPVRGVLSALRRHYGRLAVQAASNHPTLLPWASAHPDLRAMVEDLGVRVERLTLGDRAVDVALPGFERFFDIEIERQLEKAVFGPDGLYRADVPAIGAEDGRLPGSAGAVPRRAMPPDWYDPRPGGPGAPLVGAPDAGLMDAFRSAAEYALYQADRFYRREPPSDAERAMRRPDFQNVAPPPVAPDYDFHRIVASFGDYSRLLRALGLAIDFLLEDDGLIEGAIASPSARSRRE